ncbi:MAG: GNAT family N-acetyltransferase, partial [Limibacillus sp.]
RRGIGRALMLALEVFAAGRGRHLLTLDTRSGDAAEPLYLGLGYQPIGQIPGFSRDTFTDRLDATTIMYKTLAPGETA